MVKHADPEGQGHADICCGHPILVSFSVPVAFLKLSWDKQPWHQLIASATVDDVIKIQASFPNFTSNGIAQLDFHTSASQDMNPKSLRVTQTVIFALYFREQDVPLFRMPKEKIGDTAAALPILLSHLPRCQG